MSDKQNLTRAAVLARMEKAAQAGKPKAPSEINKKRLKAVLLLLEDISQKADSLHRRTGHDGFERIRKRIRKGLDDDIKQRDGE